MTPKRTNEILNLLTTSLIYWIDIPTDEKTDENIIHLLDSGILNADFINYIINPSEQVKLKFCELYPKSLKYIKNPSLECFILALQSDPTAVDYVEKLTPDMKFFADMSNNKQAKKIGTWTWNSLDIILNPSEWDSYE